MNQPVKITPGKRFLVFILFVAVLFTGVYNEKEAAYAV